MKNITIVKAKDTEWLIVNNKVEENLTFLSQKNKAQILSAVSKRVGATSSNIKVIKTSLPVNKKHELSRIVKGVNYGV